MLLASLKIELGLFLRRRSSIRLFRGRSGVEDSQYTPGVVRPELSTFESSPVRRPPEQQRRRPVVLERIDRVGESGSLLAYNSSDLFGDEVSYALSMRLIASSAA